MIFRHIFAMPRGYYASAAAIHYFADDFADTLIAAIDAGHIRHCRHATPFFAIFSIAEA